MTFNEFCTAIYRKKTSKSQGAFVSALFYAAGSNYGSKPPKNDDYLGKIFRGEPLTQVIKDSFPKPFHEKELIAFLNSIIDDRTLSEIMAAFQLPSTVDVNKSKFLIALSRQFQLFIAAESAVDVINIIVTDYPALLNCDEMEIAPAPPLYSNDSFYIPKDTKAEYSVGCYTQIDHTFVIENYSRIVDWTDRHLEFDTTSTDKITPITQTVQIPFAKHGGKATITLQVKSKGVEGTYYPKWVIKDKDGNPCFLSRTIDIKITVDFKLNK